MKAACLRVDCVGTSARRSCSCAAGRRVLREHGEVVAAVERRSHSSAELASTTSMPSGSARVLHHLDRLRMAVAGDDERRRSCS